MCAAILPPFMCVVGEGMGDRGDLVSTFKQLVKKKYHFKNKSSKSYTYPFFSAKTIQLGEVTFTKLKIIFLVN